MKHHIQTLDGLRGIAALCVFLFHVVELIVPGPAQNAFRHAYLAVDFFFCLSGFIIGHAYDEGLAGGVCTAPTLTFRAFIVRRLVRLHPLVVVGAILGLCAYLFDPFMTADQKEAISDLPWLVALNFGLIVCILPSPALPASWNMTHSLNGPAWSLFQEYLVNFAYGLFGYRFSKQVLVFIAGTGVSGLLLAAMISGSLTGGWAWDNAWVGFVRVTASFTIGLLIYRLNWGFRLPFAFPVLGLGLAFIFAAPEFKPYGGVFDWLMVVFAFPAIIMLANRPEARSRPRLDAIARISGRLSYPLYILHYPFLYVFAHWIWQAKPNPTLLWTVAVAIMVAVPVIAWLLLILIDEPLRGWLRKISTRPSGGAPRPIG
ncbi:acyltransferase family protein [Asticcacaulis sp. W401b]|uniref:acyltransferase family protein n=1 Tax=Asticcacaulis sp. W401b TaxID=3388666 RepID=UPI003970F86A